MNLQDLVLLPAAMFDFSSFFLNLVLTTLLSWLLARLYRVCGNSLSNRASFANIFIVVALATFLVISVVKTSLALSLGLIGALSIVRFRAAIKEPEELAYLFVAIGIGLGLGAEQRLVTVIALLFIGGIVYLRYKIGWKPATLDDGLYLTINAENINVSEIESALESALTLFRLKRFDRRNNRVEALYLIKMQKGSSIQLIDETFKSLDESIMISLLDKNSNTMTSP